MNQQIKILVEEVLLHIEKVTGLKFQEKDKPGIETKLTRHSSSLGFSHFSEYAVYLRGHMIQETPKLISLITTHHTAFFREFVHFEELEKTLLLQILKEKKNGKLKVWSAAASLGHEPYSLAMFLEQISQSTHTRLAQLGFEILATDVDEQSVARGANGVYLQREVNQSPACYLKEHWAKGKDGLEGWVKARQSLKSKITFKSANLLQIGRNPPQQKFDFIFCRNVFLYFTKEQIQATVTELLRHLEPWGVLFLGVCENLNDLNLPVVPLGNSVFVPLSSVHLKSHLKGDLRGDLKSRPVLTPRLAPLSVPAVQGKNADAEGSLQRSTNSVLANRIQRNIRVIVVDDSATVLALMKKILTPEKGFEIVATAKNLTEARSAVSRLAADLAADVMTLDLHLGAEMGTDYLKTINAAKHMPVVLVSALSREQESVAKEALKLGAADYVEKPEGSSLDTMGDELCAKLRIVARRLPQASGVSTAAVGTTAHTIVGAPQTATAIKVLIVDDSQTMLRVLSQMISSDKRFEVVGTVSSPAKIQDEIRRLKPHVMTLDMNMPEMNGVEVLQRMPIELRVPAVVVSSLGLEQCSLVLEALQAGAVEYFPKPALADLAAETHVLLEKIETASKVKMQKTALSGNRVAGRARRASKSELNRVLQSVQRSQNARNSNPPGGAFERIVGIGASTGGTEAIRELLQDLPDDVPPVVIVQHIPPVFSAAFAQRLQKTCNRPVHEVKNGEALVPGHCYVAPGDKHFVVKRSSRGFVAELLDSPKVNGHKPSVDVLFDSLAALRGCALTGVLLTGMGTDGAAGLLRMRQLGAHTICQSERTCVVFGMPRAGVGAGAAEFVDDLEEIPSRIVDCLKAG